MRKIKIKFKFLAYPLAVISMSLFVIVGCSDDDPEPDSLTVTDIDENVYRTVIIGDQEWMAENLGVTRYNNGDAIPAGLSNEEWENTTEGAYAIYPHEGGGTEDHVEGIGSDEEMVDAYGKQYNWWTVDDSRGLCPEGWRVPSDDDWTQLVNYVADQGFPNSSVANGAGNALKSCRQVDSPLGDSCDTSVHPCWNSDDTHYGFDEFGFSALPGGLRWTTGGFLRIGHFGYWWSSTETSSADAFCRYMTKSGGLVLRNDFNKRLGFSVRCVRDL